MNATQPAPRRTRRESARARETRDSLIELAATMFAEQGYGDTSIRDISRKAEVTSGAIYGHFRNKADLLAAAISQRTAEELESRSVAAGEEGDYVETLTRLAAEFPRRRRLRALILQGAAAAQTDPETRRMLLEEQLSYIDRWSEQYEENRHRMGIHPEVDMRAALLFSWAVELGLGVLEGIGVDLPAPDTWSDVQNRFARGLKLDPDPANAKPKRRRRQRTGESGSGLRPARSGGPRRTPGSQ